MKKITLVVSLVSLFATSAFAASITGTKHDLRSGGAQTIKGAGAADGGDQLCIYCHTPHNATKAIPLWNRTNPNLAGVTYYNTGTNLSAIAQGMTTLPAESVSMFCLSCHDGALGATGQATVGNRVAKNKTGGAGITMGAGTWSNGGLLDGGNSLTNDHPVGFSYEQARQDAKHGARTKDFKVANLAVTGPEALGLKFFPSKDQGGVAITDAMECASCHLVHDNVNGKFLRMSNAGSALCLACHDK